MNLQASFQNLAKPEMYAGAFQLSGVPGRVAVAGMGILFLMWQVPYFVALLDPLRYRVSLHEAIVMQMIGLLGESLLRRTIGAPYAELRSSILRYIVFDALGLLFLLGAGLLVHFYAEKMPKPAEESR